MSRYLLFWIILVVGHVNAQEISECLYLDRPHFLVVTDNAKFLYDRNGGGFSSIRDQGGNEWVGYQAGHGKVPESAAADFRGMPNLVFRGADNGVGHPGFDQCLTEHISPNKLRTVSTSGKWTWEWNFDENGAWLDLLQIDTTRQYWFLYEGIPGGVYAPRAQFWGNNKDGTRYDTPPLQSDSLVRGSWDWAFFGHRSAKRALVLIQLTPDEQQDNFSYMGSSSAGVQAKDGMVVFGFGRSGSTPLMRRPNRFFVGFCEAGPGDFPKLKRWVNRRIKDQ